MILGPIPTGTRRYRTVKYVSKRKKSDASGTGTGTVCVVVVVGKWFEATNSATVLYGTGQFTM